MIAMGNLLAGEKEWSNLTWPNICLASERNYVCMTNNQTFVLAFDYIQLIYRLFHIET